MRLPSDTKQLLILTLLTSVFFFLHPYETNGAACSEDQYLKLAYPNDLDIVKDDGINKQYRPYVGKTYTGDKRPITAPENSGLIWVPKEACGQTVDLLIALHGWRSLSKPGVNVYLQSPDQKQFNVIIRNELNAKKILPIVVAAPMHDRGPDQTVWDEKVYNINTHIKKIMETVKAAGINVEFNRVSLVGHSNANCGGGLARAAKDLQGYQLYLYGAADGTCGSSENEPFFNKYNVFPAVKGDDAILFHLHQSNADGKAAAEVKDTQTGGLDTETIYTAQYNDRWRSMDGKLFTYGLTPGGDHDHTHAPQYLLREILPRFFAPTPYDPTVHPPAAGSSSGYSNPNPTDVKVNVFTPQTLTESELQKLLQKPMPRIKIPGLNFSDPGIEGLKQNDDGGDVYIHFPFIGEYIAAVYRYLVVAAGILCVVLIIIAGLRWVMSGGSAENIAGAQKMIRQALVGLVIAVSSYSILYLVNPELVRFRSLRVLFVRGFEGSAEHTLQKQAEENGQVKPSPCTGKKEPSVGIFGTSDFGRSEPYSCGNRDLNNVKYLVIHEGSAGDTIGLLTSRGLSTHFVIQRDGKVIQAVDIRRRAGHAGSIMNPWSVGVDLQIPIGCNQAGSCVNSKECSSQCSYTSEQYEALNQLIEVLKNKTAIRRSDDSIIAHCQIRYAKGGHGDPRNFNWTLLGLSLDKHRGGDNMINGKCIKTFSADTHNSLVEAAKKKKSPATGVAGCCELYGEDGLPKFKPTDEAQCLATGKAIQFREESCPL